MNVFEPGRCRYCGCDESNPCRLSTGDACAWFNQGRNVCTQSSCIRRYEQERRDAPKRRKMTPAEVHALITRRNKPRSRRRKKVA